MYSIHLMANWAVYAGYSKQKTLKAAVAFN